MRRFVNVMFSALLFLMLSSSLVWGSGSEEEGGTVTLDLLSFGDNSSPDSKAFNDLLEQFKAENPGITVKQENLFDEAYHQKVQARLQSGDVPDVLYAWASPRSAPLYQSKQAVNLAEYVDLSKYNVAAVAPKSPMPGVEVGVYVLPISLGVNSVFYENTKLLKELGLQSPRTYEDLQAMLPKIREAGLEPVAMANAAAWVMNSTLFGTITARVTGNPNWLKEASEGKRKFTDPEFVKALQFVKTMYDDGVIDKKSLQVDYGAALGMYMGEKAVFMIDGHWRLGAIAENEALLDSTAMKPFPILSGEKSAVATTSAGEPTPGFTVTRKALDDPKKRVAAMKFLEFIGGEQAALSYAKNASLIPILKSVDPATLGDKAIEKKSEFYSSVKVLANTPDQVLPSKINEVLNNGLQEIGLGTAVPESVAEAMENAR